MSFNISDEEKKRWIHELILKGESAKHYFARVVLIENTGGGKTSLRHRLLWQNRNADDSTGSTDGIEIEKCNINVINGKWSQCDSKTLC